MTKSASLPAAAYMGFSRCTGAVAFGLLPLKLLERDQPWALELGVASSRGGTASICLGDLKFQWCFA